MSKSQYSVESTIKIDSNRNLESLLLKWKFPKDVIEKYKSLKILEIFDWQAECLQIQEVLGK